MANPPMEAPIESEQRRLQQRVWWPAFLAGLLACGILPALAVAWSIPWTTLFLLPVLVFGLVAVGLYGLWRWEHPATPHA